MMNSRGHRRGNGPALASLMAGAAMVALTPTAAFAQADDIKDAMEPSIAVEAADPGDPGSEVNLGNIQLNLSAAVTTEYWFRGIGQENQGFIFQPGADINVNLLGDEERELTVDAYIGTWNSLHSNDTLGTAGGHNWYESDWTFGVALGLPQGLGLNVSYIVLYSPDGGDIFAEEIDLALTFDDAPIWKQLGVKNLALSPSVLVAIETDGGSDAGDDLGVYGEIAIAPTLYTVESTQYPITLSLPVILGLSLDNYYENTDGESDFFGYLQIGVEAGVPLPFIPQEYGVWEASAGIHGIFLGDTAQDISEAFGTGDDEFSLFGTIGISASY